MTENEATKEKIMIFVLIGGLHVIAKTTDREGEMEYPMILGQQAPNGVSLIPFAQFSETSKITIRPDMMVTDPYKPVSKMISAYEQVITKMKLEKVGMSLATDIPGNITKLHTN